MNTEQSYVGGGDYATTRPHPAKPGIPTSFLADQHPFDSANPKANLQQVQEELLDQIGAYAQNYSPVPLLNEIILNWLQTPFQEVQDTNTKNNLRLLLNLTSFLIEIKETYQTYEFFLDQWKQNQGGEGQADAV